MVEKWKTGKYGKRRLLTNVTPYMKNRKRYDVIVKDVTSCSSRDVEAEALLSGPMINRAKFSESFKGEEGCRRSRTKNGETICYKRDPKAFIKKVLVISYIYSIRDLL